MQNKEKVALFDFCETLVPFQSADAFIEYVGKEQTSVRAKIWKKTQQFLWKYQGVRILTHFFPNSSVNKRLMLKQLSKLSQSYLESMAKQFYYNIIKHSFIPELLNELRKKREENFRIIIVSGGFDIYLKYFMEDFNLNKDDLICTKLSFKNGVFSGSFEEPDCMGSKKVILVDKHISRQECYVEAYSDSISDLPLLQYADKAYVIVEEGKKNWVNINNFKFETILWQH